MIIAASVIALIFGVAFVICKFIGGGPEEFASAAAPWVLMAIGIAAFAAMQTSESVSKDQKLT